MSNYSEDDFICPALKIMASRSGGFISTTELIHELEQEMRPTPPDTDILNNRNDSHFSQKVRNLVSHRNFVGFAIYDANKHGWQITEAGTNKAQTC